MIHLERHGHVGVAKLERDVTNAIGPEFVEALAGTLERAQRDPGQRALVLASSNEKFFSIGLDIPKLFELTREKFSSFYAAFNRACLDVYTFPKPTFAAITGHAIAGGCILALCCDYRFIAEGRRLMGLNEIKLGVPVPYVGDCILRQLVGVRNAREVMDAGEFYRPEELLQIGMVDQVLPLDQVLPEAIERAALLGAFPQEAFSVIKRNRVEKTQQEILAQLAEREQLFVECWYADETRKRLREAMEKF